MNEANAIEVKNTNAPSAEQSQTNMSPLEVSVNWWSSWSDLLGGAGVVVGGFLAFVAMVGWGFSWKSGKLKDELVAQKEEALERYKKDADTRISEANKIAAIANEGQAKANERAALLEKETTVAKLELEKIKEKHRWRSVSPEQKAKFIALSASSPKGRVTLFDCVQNEESRSYSIAIRDLLIEAGYSVDQQIYSSHEAGGRVSGIGFWVTSRRQPMHAAPLHKALTEIGIESSPEALDHPDGDEVISIAVRKKPGGP